VSPSASDRLLFEAGEARLEGWVVVAVEGGHRERFLHSQLTSDVEGLDEGASQMTALLDRTGRLQVFGFLHKRPDRIDLLLPETAAAPALEFLEGHIIADDVSLRVVETGDLTLLLGAEAVRLIAELPPGSTMPIEGWGSRGCVTWDSSPPRLPAIHDDELEARRVLSGIPLWGVEAAQGQLIHETSLIAPAVSLAKGCFLGQETVAKVSSGRGAARSPVLLEIVAGDSIDAAGAAGEFAAEGNERAGSVLMVTRWEERTYLLASAVREMRVENREVVCRWSDGSASTVRVRALPLLRTPDPGYWATRLQLRAVEAFSYDREDDAVKLLERAIAVCRDHADSYESLGVILGRHHRYDEAIALMRRLLEVNPSSVMAHTNLSLYYNRLGRIDDAEREAGEALRAKMDRERDQKQRAEALREETALTAADRKRREDMFRQVLEIDPDDALGNFGLGELLAEEGRYEDAISHLRRALQADPRYSAAFLALGRALEGADDLAAAGATYREGIKVAAAKGDLSTANKMQERLANLQSEPHA
jgi:folate-binding protein YgfZ